ncbi:FAD-binding protein [Thermoanaerobacteraceae bacterium SP2]|jgi:succinate dehydrogenase/fumarate reductase flavoprotein subunit|nr:fumarate reductase (CoM/CoB) subunit [Clostridiales bacterium]RKL63634.1 FAD-binding protein [Thermoanaerobacteraceae bacterium SP2]
MEPLNTDVLIIGGGGAACRAAIEAAGAGVQVTMILKGKLGESGATAYKVAEMAGFNVADGLVDPGDCPEEHYKDIIHAGAGMADPTLARIVAEEAPLALKTLKEWGVPFEMDKDHYLEFLSCFSTRPRTHVIKGHGEPIMKALIERIKKYGNIRIFEDCIVTNLFVQDDECAGAGFLEKSGDYHTIASGAVIIATGGAGRLFANNLNPPDICGDGYTLGYEAGAELINMEFMQAGLGIVYPVVNILNAWIWSAHPDIKNRYREHFLKNYLPKGISEEDVMDAHAHHFPFSSADASKYLEVAIQGEIAEGKGTDEGGIYLDLTGITDEYLNSLPEEDDFKKMWPITRDYLLTKGVDVSKKPVQIACFGHAINGGLKINAEGKTTVPGLYAAGEVAGGPHGADRLGGNMMVTCQVFGARAGRFAAREAQNKGKVCLSESLIKQEKDSIFNNIGKDVDVKTLKVRLQNEAQSKLLVRRNKKGLEEFLNTIYNLREEVKKASSSVPKGEVWELLSLARSGELMAKAALGRYESRGSHFRTDFPDKNDKEYGYPQIIFKTDNGPEIKKWRY